MGADEDQELMEMIHALPDSRLAEPLRLICERLFDLERNQDENRAD